MKINYHTHTQRCRHAQGSEEDYVKSALKAGLNLLGFSDHAPFPDRDFGLRMPYTELTEHIRTIDLLTAKYSADIILYKGLEIEYLPEYHDYYESLLQVRKLDYLLLGEHFFRNQAGDLFNITQAHDTGEYVDYAHAVVRAMKTGYFCMVAHPDIFTMNRFAWDRNCDAACDMIIDAALSTDTILEFNANGFRRGIHDYPDGKRFMYPHPAFWKRVAAAHARVIIGSDCHNPAQVWDQCLPDSYDYVKSLGITPVETAEKRILCRTD